jgi:hypothetical protein
VLLDACGRPRSPATLPGFHTGRSPRNKGRRYPADPPTVAGVVAVMQHAADGLHGARLRALIVVLWRAGLRIHEALALSEADLDERRGSLLVRRGKGGRRREVGMDDWAWEQLRPWLRERINLPVGPLLCIATGPTRGRAWSAGAARAELRHAAARAHVRRRFAPHQLRHAHAVEMAWKASRSSSSNASSATRTSGSPRSTRRASTAPRSSTASTPATPNGARRPVAAPVGRRCRSSSEAEVAGSARIASPAPGRSWRLQDAEDENEPCESDAKSSSPKPAVAGRGRSP